MTIPQIVRRAQGHACSLSLMALNLALAAIAPLSAGEAPLPTFPKRMLYAQARTALLALGYQPVHLPDADTCEPQDDASRCFPEREACAGTGLAPCNFVWRRGERVIMVGTIGDETPIVISVRCLSGCPF